MSTMASHDVHLVSLLLCLPILCSTTPVRWPYLQVYPPVNETDTRTPLYFALMLSLGGDFTTIGALPGIQVALDSINNDLSFLPGYSLHYTLTDSQCNRTVAIDSFFREINRPPTKVGWIGSGCAVATEPTAELSQFFNITQLSCTSAYHGEDLSFYFQLVASSGSLSRGFLAVIQFFKWTRVSIFTQNENIFVKMTDHLKRYLSHAEIEYSERVFSTSDSISGLGNEPFDGEYRVFILAMYSPHARSLLCEASRRGITYPTHQFLLFGWYEEDWYVERVSGSVNCSLEERSLALQYAITVRSLDYNTDPGLITEGGLSLEDFEKQYEEKLRDPLNRDLDLQYLVKDGHTFPYAQQCHEAVLTMAKALQLVSQDLNTSNTTLNMEAGEEAGLSGNETFTLANFAYSNSAIVHRMFHHISKTNFTGITGRTVSFTANRTRPMTSIIIQQYRPTDYSDSIDKVTIGHVPVETPEFSILEGVTVGEIFPHGVPTDGSHERNIVTVAAPVTALFSILSVCGICFAVVCLVFNYVCRKKKLMVLSGTYLNYLIGAGTIILLLGVIIEIIPVTDQKGNAAICIIFNSLTSIGFSLTNGTIALKVIRVWYINNRPKLNEKFSVKDIHIFVIIMILVALDVVIISLYLLIAGLVGVLEADFVLNRENPEDMIGPTKKIVENYFYVSSRPGTQIIFSILIGGKVLLLLVALVFSLRTQKMKTKGQDDSKYTAAAVYVMNAASVVIVVSNISLVEFLNARLIVLALAHLLGSTAVLCLIFIPKMVAIYKDPEGDKVVMTGSGMIVGACRQYTVTTQDEREIEGLRQRLKQLQDCLKQYGTEIQEDDQEDEEQPQGKVLNGERVSDGHSLDDTCTDVRSIPNSHVSRTFTTD